MVANPALPVAPSGATGSAEVRTGHISLSEEYRTLQELANNYYQTSQRESALFKAQMSHLVEVVNEKKQRK